MNEALPGDRIFDNIFAVFDHLKQVGWTLDPFSPRGPFKIVTYPGKRIVASPLPSNPLFRGQTDYHTPCLPTLYRGKLSVKELFLNRLKFEEWKLLLNTNPHVKELLDQGYFVNYTGLAQHYGFETNLLDFTNNIYVAAFFATCQYIASKDTYFPVVDPARIGVIYFMSWGGPFWPGCIGNPTKLIGVGLEEFNRPGDQKAFVYDCNEGEDINENWMFMKLRFRHSPAASFRIYELMQRGRLLFPYDPAAKMARNIINGRVHSSQAVKNALKTVTVSSEDLHEYLRAYDIKIRDEIYRFSKEDIRFYDSRKKSGFYIVNPPSLSFTTGPVESQIKSPGNIS